MHHSFLTRFTLEYHTGRHKFNRMENEMIKDVQKSALFMTACALLMLAFAPEGVAETGSEGRSSAV